MKTQNPTPSTFLQQPLCRRFGDSIVPCHRSRMDIADLGAATTFAVGGPPSSTVWDMPDDDTMLQQISVVLQQLCAHSSVHLGACPTIFDSAAPPLLLPSVHCYLVRIHCYTEFDSVCFLVALSYIMRIGLWDEEHGLSLRPTTHNIHRLFIAALVVASKTNDGAASAQPRPPSSIPHAADHMRTPLLNHTNQMRTPRLVGRAGLPSASTPLCSRADTFHPNKFMAKCGGITNAELNKLEVDLCERLRWDLAVQPDELIALTNQLQGDVSTSDDDSSALLDSPV